MEKIMLARCCIQEMGKMFFKYCFVYDGTYYDILNLNVYNNFDGENGIIQAEMLNENELKAESRENLYKRKRDLVNRLKASKFGLFDGESLESIIDADKMSLVLYRQTRILLDKNADVYFEEIEEPNLGIMLNSEVYDVKTQERVQTIADDLSFGDLCLYSVRPIPSSIFSEEDYMGLVLVANSIIGKGDKPKIVYLH